MNEEAIQGREGGGRDRPGKSGLVGLNIKSESENLINMNTCHD